MSNFFSRNDHVFGGTESVVDIVNGSIIDILPKFEKYNLIVIPGRVPDFWSLDSRPLIVWLHNTLRQYSPVVPRVITHPDFVKRVKFFIVPSNFAKEKLIEYSSIPAEKILVIHNGFLPLQREYVPPKTNEPVQLMYTSDPTRGLELLLYTIPKIQGNFEVKIFSDWDPNLNDFKRQNNPLPWTRKSIKDDKIRVFGKSYNGTIRKFLVESHVLAYPSTYLETFCLAYVEGLSAGLSCVTPSVGALPEVGGDFISKFQWQEPFLDLVKSDKGGFTDEFRQQYEDNFNDNINSYADALSEAIQDIRDEKFDPTAQQQYVNDKFSWKTIEKRWKQVHDELL